MSSRDTAVAPLAAELRESMGRLVRRLRAEPGPSLPRMTVLGRLDREGPASVSELAAAERMRPQSMASTVADLEEDGLVARRPDPQDRRRAFVELTAEGRAVLQAKRAQRESWLAGAIERTLDEREQQLLREALPLLSRLSDA
jgi:DNA-binding MarR family transcriptional regulator